MLSACLTFFRLVALSTLLASVFLSGALLAQPAASSGEPAAELPRLTVVVVVDQLRSDYLDRFNPWFVEGGFRRFLAHGAVFEDAHYRHALTATAPGHATLLTGVHANRHGIIGNEWRDGATLQAHTSVSDANHPLVGVEAEPAGPGGVFAGRLGASPHRLLALTVGDQVKLRHGDRSRVVALGHKDRAPIMMGGRFTDGAYWLHEDKFVTSTYYRHDLPDWLQRFQTSDRVRAVFDRTWDRLLPAEAYAVQGPDDAEGEALRLGLGRTFPRRIGGESTQPDRQFVEAFRLLPHADDLLVELAEAAIAGEGLGRHPGPDLLCLGFSTLDHAGHAWGPDSHEIMDVVLRLDRALARLFGYLDREVGAGQWTAVLSADHGVAPLPERVLGFNRSVPAGRLDGARLGAEIESALSGAFGPLPEGLRWAVRDGYGFRLQPAALAAHGIARDAAASIAKRALLRNEQIGVAWTREDLSGVPSLEAPHFHSWRLSFHDERSPDIVFSARPYIVDIAEGSNHGTPYTYDTHVPLAWYGRGVSPGRHAQRVGVDSLATTLAALLGVPAPPEATAPRLF